MTVEIKRKGARKVAAITGEVLRDLNAGKIESATLTECLGINQVTLFNAVFPDASEAVRDEVQVASELGILKRMNAMGTILLAMLGQEGIARLTSHPSDMVRGWACFMIGKQASLSLSERLVAMVPFADDTHFGVREWAWMAVRPHLEADLEQSIALLLDWTHATSERIRRFACESIRPRGVWCTHISVLKKSPELALPLLQALRDDPAVYVQDSVANWLNDAGKTQGAWVSALCAQWLKESPTAATARICQRAQRNLV